MSDSELFNLARNRDGEYALVVNLKVSEFANENDTLPPGKHIAFDWREEFVLKLRMPLPPAELVASLDPEFAVASEVEKWLRAAFLDQNSPLYNVEHDHLNSATIGILWTNAESSRHMKRVVGTAETGKPPSSLGKWARARSGYQMRQWFGTDDLDFIITLFAPYFAGASEVEQCAIIEHELYHCGQGYDEFGCPKFKKDGKPAFGIRGHDVEEFVGIVRRYGVGGAAGDTAMMVSASLNKPEVSQVDIQGLCGVCQ